jgi:hypothetical protein
MNKKDFMTLIIYDIVTLLLLIEHLCGLELALALMCIWTMISMIAHISIFKDYIFAIVVEE